MNDKRRTFIKNSSLALGAIALSPLGLSCSGEKTENMESDVLLPTEKEAWNFDISLAEWSFHRALFAKEFANMDFPLKAKELGIMAVEYVSTFFKDELSKTDYLQELRSLTTNEGIRNVLIMVDGEGGLGELDDQKRKEAVENHHKWIDAAKFLGCHSIRVNAYGQGTSEEVMAAAVDGLGSLSEYGAQNKINVIVENHGGYSSNGKWLTSVMKQVDNPYCGTLPDFGNFKISDGEFYDHYLGIEEMMPFAKGVSAKAHDFDKGLDSNICNGSGNVGNGEIDFDRMLKIVKNANYRGYIGIEYEGSKLPESVYIAHVKKILERVRFTLA